MANINFLLQGIAVCFLAYYWSTYKESRGHGVVKAANDSYDYVIGKCDYDIVVNMYSAVSRPAQSHEWEHIIHVISLSFIKYQQKHFRFRPQNRLCKYLACVVDDFGIVYKCWYFDEMHW